MITGYSYIFFLILSNPPTFSYPLIFHPSPHLPQSSHYTIYYTIFFQNDDFWRSQTKSKNPQNPCKIRLYGLWHHRTKPPQTSQEVSANFLRFFRNVKWKSYFWFFSVFLLSKIGGWILLLQSCYPVIPRADRWLLWQLIILVTLNTLLSLTVQILRSWLKRASLFHRWQGLFPRIPLPSLKKSDGIVSLFPTIGTRTAADAVPLTVRLFSHDLSTALKASLRLHQLS